MGLKDWCLSSHIEGLPHARRHRRACLSIGCIGFPGLGGLLSETKDLSQKLGTRSLAEAFWGLL